MALNRAIGLVAVTLGPSACARAVRPPAELGFDHFDATADDVDGLDAERSPRWRCRSVTASARTRRGPDAPPCRCTSAGVRTASTRRWRCSAPSRARGWSPGPAASPTASRRWRPSSRRSRGLRLTVDTGHVATWGEDPIRLLRHADHVQLRQAAPGKPQLHPDDADGVVDFAAVLAELERLDYPGLMSVEYFDLPDMRMPLDDPVGHAVALAAHVRRAPLIHCRVGSDFRTSRDAESPLGQRRSARKG